jgi:hypothetical protein
MTIFRGIPDIKGNFIIYIVAYLRHVRIVTLKHAPRLRNRRRRGVFSVPCRAEPKRAEESRTNPAVNELPGNRCKHLVWRRKGRSRVTATAVTSRPSNDTTIEGVLQYVSSKDLQESAVADWTRRSPSQKI